MNKFCPLIKKNCIGKKCMNWGFIQNDYKYVDIKEGFLRKKTLFYWKPNYGCIQFQVVMEKGKWKTE